MAADQLLTVDFFAGHVGEVFEIRLEHQRIGPLDISLVPLGPEKGGEGRQLYEAAFS